MIARAATLALTATLFAGCTTADATPPSDNPDFSCTLRHPSKSVASLKKLPAPVRAYIKDKVGEIADRREFFNAGDAVTRPGPFNRFIRGGTISDSNGTEHWFLWYEHGGFAYWRQIEIFKRDTVTGAAHLNAEQHGGRDLCADTDALLDKAAKVGL